MELSRTSHWYRVLRNLVLITTVIVIDDASSAAEDGPTGRRLEVAWPSARPNYPASCTVYEDGRVEATLNGSSNVKIFSRVSPTDAAARLDEAELASFIKTPPEMPRSRRIIDEINLSKPGRSASAPRSEILAKDQGEYDRLMNSVRTLCKAAAKAPKAVTLQDCNGLDKVLAFGIPLGDNRILTLSVKVPRRGVWTVMLTTGQTSTLKQAAEGETQESTVSTAELSLSTDDLISIATDIRTFAGEGNGLHSVDSQSKKPSVSYSLQFEQCRAFGSKDLDPKAPESKAIMRVIDKLAKAHNAATSVDPYAVLMKGAAFPARATTHGRQNTDPYAKLRSAKTFKAFMDAIEPLRPTAVDNRLPKSADALLAKLEQDLAVPLDRSLPDLVAMKRAACSPNDMAEAKQMTGMFNRERNHHLDFPRIESIKNHLSENPGIASAMLSSREPRALFVLGRLMESDLVARQSPGVPWSQIDAMTRFVLASNAGSVAARARLLSHYKRMSSLENFDIDAWHKEASTLAGKGSAEAAFALGEHYERDVYPREIQKTGSFIPLEKRTELRRWYCRASDLGYVPGFNKCGDALYYGIGGPADRPRGIKLLEKAAKNNQRAAPLTLAKDAETKGDKKAAAKWRCVSLKLGN